MGEATARKRKSSKRSVTSEHRLRSYHQSAVVALISSLALEVERLLSRLRQVAVGLQMLKEIGGGGLTERAPSLKRSKKRSR